MPRFENKGFNPEKRNRNEQADRTVPQDENYYGYSPVDLNFNNRKSNSDIVKDNQRDQFGINPCDNFDFRTNTQPMYRNQPNQRRSEQQFQSETPLDFDFGNSRAKENPARRDKPPQKKSADKKNRAKGKKRRKLSIGKQILIFLLVLILIITGGVGVVMGKINYNDKKENTYISAAELESGAMVKNVLLLGVDARAGENADETRSDTMMLVSVDMKHKCIKMISFLRDTWVYIPSLGYEQRLNAACSSGGYQGVVDAIEYNFGVDIDGYAVVDFEMFKVLVDSLGGVEVDVTKKEADEVTNHPYRYDHVTLDEGKYKLSGEQALAYCRIRKIDTDFVRTQRQRTVMSAILDSAKHANPFKLYNMIYKSAPYIETDLTKGELMNIAAMAGICLTGEMHQTKVPFEGTWEYANIRGNSVIGINAQENKDKLIDYIYNLNSDDIAKLEAEKDE